ncbi:MAG: hypothetical protein FJX22_02175 [Alphaproteobacteria bacterium]|nr:hypothetical protein [Alphaproteobacteria bacterium]
MTDYSLYNIHGHHVSLRALSHLLQDLDEKTGLIYWSAVFYADNGDMMVLVENNSQAYFLIYRLAITNQLDDHLGLSAWRETLLESPSKARLKKMITDLHGSSNGISHLIKTMDASKPKLHLITDPT